MSAQAITVTCDVLVAGSGAAGFATALTAQLQGLDVIMVEKAPLFGGTTAYSAGVVWIPVNAVQRAAGLADSRQSALDYLAHHVGNRLDQARAEAFLDGILGSFNRAPTTLAMVGLQATTRRPCSTASHARGLPSFRRCRPGPTITPTSRAPAGAADHLGRRSLTAASGERFSQAARADQDHGGVWRHDDRPQRSALHFQMSRSLKAAVHVGGMVMRFARDRLTYPRGTRLVNGDALIARMAAATIARGIPLWRSRRLSNCARRGAALSAPSSTRRAKPLR